MPSLFLIGSRSSMSQFQILCNGVHVNYGHHSHHPINWWLTRTRTSLTLHLMFEKRIFPKDWMKASKNFLLVLIDAVHSMCTGRVIFLVLSVIVEYSKHLQFYVSSGYGPTIDYPGGCNKGNTRWSQTKLQNCRSLKAIELEMKLLILVRHGISILDPGNAGLLQETIWGSRSLQIKIRPTAHDPSLCETYSPPQQSKK